MTIKTKKFTVRGEAYHIKQHPAIEGCSLLERYHNAINAFFKVIQTPVYSGVSKINIFSFAIDGGYLGLLMFLDRLSNPEAPLEVPEHTPVVKSPYLTLKEIKAGTTIADRKNEAQPERPSLHLSHAINYAATTVQDSTDTAQNALQEFLAYVTQDGDQIDLDDLDPQTMAELLVRVLEFNFMGIWANKRFSLPENFSSGQPTLGQVERARSSYSQSNVIYTILQSDLALSTYADLATILNTEDAYNMNESALLSYYQTVEAQKEAEKQAKTRK
nr:hypothetical protein [uncultured Pseudomonas sp.]